MNATNTPRIIIYGIPQCDTVKKSRAWLDASEKTYQFHDFKKQGVPEAALHQWALALGWQALINKKGSTWRKLSATEQAAVIDEKSAIALMLANASVIKRPVLSIGEKITVGYTPEQW